MTSGGIIQAYLSAGIPGLREYFDVDALIGGQGWCQSVYRAFCEEDYEQVSKLIEDEIDNSKTAK